MPADLPKARELFLHAVGKLPPEDWDNYVTQACGGDAELRRQLAHLLQVHREAGSFLERPAAELAGAPAGADPAAGESPAERPGTVVGAYRLIEVIGEGGMGTVYMAQQTEPVKRPVALKLIKPGMDSRAVVARFEAERQALALMDHPNIAKVLDGGTTGGEPGGVSPGRPYFVMELVKGIPITRFCDEQHLTPRERLELFVPVCQAVQHAHQKGIIHRDLKPSNVLVALYDGKPVPKVIDFGVAKAVAQPLTEKTLVTGFGALVGTLEYMSPEQAELNQLDIDTRSDIYSLGVLLYELLTGTTPIQGKQLRAAALLEALRLIREAEPQRPSALLSTTQELPSVAASRGVEPRRLAGLVRGELDWMVMRALEKDRQRRYETANGLAADVQRYLADEPVQACPPSRGYRLRKFARRHHGALATAGVLIIILLIIIGAVAGSIGWVARDRAARQAEAEKAVSAALAEAESLQRQDRWPEALSAVRRADALLAGTGADEPLARKVREQLHDLELLDRLEQIRLGESARVKDGHFDSQWADDAYGRAFREAGVDVQALCSEDAAARARTFGSPVELAAALDNWAMSRRARGAADDPSWKALLRAADLVDPDPWRKRLRKALASRDRRTLRELAASADVSALPPATLAVFGEALVLDRQTGVQVEAFLRQAQRQYPADFWLSWNLVRYLQTVQPPRAEEALRFAAVAVSLRPQSAGAHFNLGSALSRADRPDEAIAAYRQAIRLKPDYAAAHNSLGSALMAKCRLDEAVAAFRKAIQLQPDYAEAHNGLGMALLANGRRADAIAEFRMAVRLKPDYAQARSNLAAAVRDPGRRSGPTPR